MPGLVLKRTSGQQIVIGGNVFVTVEMIEAKANRTPGVYLRIEAPPHISVDRLEVFEAKKKAKQ